MTFDKKKDTRRILTVIAASFIMAVNLNTFVHAGDLFPGGATGLTLLIQRSLLRFAGVHISYTLINVLINMIPVYIGFRYIGKKFTLYSVLVIFLNGILVDALPEYTITTDPLLIAVFGGIINGFAIALCLMNDLTTGGTDFIGMFLSQKKGVDSFNIVLGLNAVILTVAGLLFGWNHALYSIIFQFVSTQTLHGLYRNYQQQTLFIVTNKAQDISDEIHKISHHGSTILKAEGSYEHEERQVVYSVVAGSDAKKVMKAVRQTDPDAFINSFRTTEVKGRFFHKPED